MTDREAFEEWMHQEFIGPSMCEKTPRDRYVHPDVQRWFEIWQAATQRTARECLKLTVVTAANGKQVETWVMADEIRAAYPSAFAKD